MDTGERTAKLCNCLKDAASIVDAMFDEGGWDDVMQDAFAVFMKRLPYEAKAILILQTLGPADELTKVDIIFAKKLAETLGPGYVNKFRRLEKLITAPQPASVTILADA